MDEQENALENIKKAHEDLWAILEDKYNSFLERNPKAEKHQIERALLAEALWWEEKLDSRMKDW